MSHIEDNVGHYLKDVIAEGFATVPEPALLEKDIATANVPHVHKAWELKIFDDAVREPPHTVTYASPGVVHASSMACSLPVEIGHQRIRIGHMKSPHCKYYILDDECLPMNIMPEMLLALARIEGYEHFAATRMKLMTAVLDNLLAILELLSANHHLAASTHSPTEKALDFMHSNYFNPDVGVEDIARYAGVSPQYLNRIFVRKTGKTTRQMLIEVRLSRAKELLEEKKFFIKDIARLTGWRCPFYFSNCFSKRYDTAPSAL